MNNIEFQETDEPKPVKEFLSELSTQFGFELNRLEEHYTIFRKSYTKEIFAQNIFEVVVNEAMTNEQSIKFAIEEFFLENNEESCKKEPFRIQARLTEQNEKGFWKADLIIRIKDWNNPGAEHTQTYGVTTNDKTKKGALVDLKKMATEFTRDMSTKLGGNGMAIDKKTGKVL